LNEDEMMNQVEDDPEVILNYYRVKGAEAMEIGR